VIYAGSGTRQTVTVALAEHARLDWHPEPLIATAGCHHRQHARITLEPTSTLDWVDEVILGRHGEPPGQLDLRLDVTVGELPLLRHQVLIGAGSPGWDGPAVLDGHRCLGLRLTTARPPCPRGWMPLHGPGYLRVAVAANQVELRRALYAS
jgi:urease accessory protein